jgi:hypothetical protein
VFRPLHSNKPYDGLITSRQLALVRFFIGATLRIVSMPRGVGRGELKRLIKALAPEPAAPISRPAAVIYIREPGSIIAPSTSGLQLLFNFTPAESFLAISLRRA